MPTIPQEIPGHGRCHIDPGNVCRCTSDVECVHEATYQSNEADGDEDVVGEL